MSGIAARLLWQEVLEELAHAAEGK
jgi:hypothetical protein